MWKAFWRKWTVDRPALLGDWLWDVLVVQFAAFLDRLTLRRVVALLPVLILIFAYYHRIPIPPELMLVGDVLAYIDIFSVLLLLGILSRVTTILFIVKQATARIASLTRSLAATVGRLNIRHRRERGTRVRKRLADRCGNEGDDEPIIVGGLALAW
ncbi:hypothetical protein [Bradyrhizobium sp. SZCCHNS2096]|uniref:hypothetical protein n=1 Tax=Bradyrhizobium sp. SZCCHNS2096 TaxID=3057309 RepID=UPI00291628C1|nr:hypothetical protein [Bradyrhizobium sp. SZCCHNS2096]